ncbi:TIGR03084 family metal-binding protein [Pacificispira sp.]|uniref:TIGR03084 family metal-binding protein n=1 Tax=Pacificispira sp. TaxID=2888761 RepID=UPI003B527C8C
MRQAKDFFAESETLYGLLDDLVEDDFRMPTQFKNWSINDVLQHLHLFNILARESIQNENAMLARLADIRRRRDDGRSLRDATGDILGGISGRSLLDAWRDEYERLSNLYVTLDPKSRLKWAGPSMSALSSVSARLMETWAHGLSVFDVLGVERKETDRIFSIAVMGNNTFGWTFKNRDEAIPETPPRLTLNAPSGEVWRFNDEAASESISGEALDFCYVVVQARNVADTRLQVSGENAARWMSVAQCFAGPPVDPPAPGTRFRAAHYFRRA